MPLISCDVCAVDHVVLSYPLHSVKRVFAQVVSGVLYLHKHRIMHRDLSPSNLLVTKSMDIVSADFCFLAAIDYNCAFGRKYLTLVLPLCWRMLGRDTSLCVGHQTILHRKHFAYLRV